MSQKIFEPGVAAGRLDADVYAAQFSDLHPPLDVHEALVAADRCYFCHDAPCITACPTDLFAFIFFFFSIVIHFVFLPGNFFLL